MTTKITIEAHCGEKNEVLVVLDEGVEMSDTIVANGDSHEVYVYDDRQITIMERPKPYVPTWQDRVVDEKSELDEKIAKLVAFLDLPAFEALQWQQQDLMKQQLEHMLNYNDVLSERIKSF